MCMQTAPGFLVSIISPVFFSVEVQQKGELKTSELKQTSGGQVIENDGWEAYKQTWNATSLTG